MLLDGLRRLLRLGKSLTLTPNNPQCPYHFNLPPIPPVLPTSSTMNCDNFMTDRPSTRVRAPPGGASSISFGGGAAPAPVRRAAPAAPRAAPASTKREEPAPKAVLQESNASAAVGAVPGAKPRVSSNAYATGSNQNCGNVITDRPTTRLHAPPGGKSSFSLGWN